MRIDAVIDSIDAEFGDEVIAELLHATRRAFDQALELLRRPQAALGVVKSPLGDLLVAATARGVALNHYVRDGADLAATIQRLRLYFDLVEDRRAAEEIGAEVRRYLAGDARALRHNVDLTLAHSAFHRKILTRLQAVPRGAVLSYRALGAAAGAAGAARAVGNAMHNNPVPIYVPCHRVIASDGGIGGYGGGLERKLQLLRAEGFAVDNPATRLSDTAVWGHRRTRIYCKRECPTVSRTDRAQVMFFAAPQLARQAGMRACKVCHPG
jgi:methylated-DNA-[protein]-cysteine S-methyltransferase